MIRWSVRLCEVRTMRARVEEALLPADVAFVLGSLDIRGFGVACWICAYWFVRSAYNEGVHS